MAFLLAGKPSGRTTLAVIDGILHARLPKTHGRYATDPGYAHLAEAIAIQANVTETIAAASQEQGVAV